MTTRERELNVGINTEDKSGMMEESIDYIPKTPKERIIMGSEPDTNPLPPQK